MRWTHVIGNEVEPSESCCYVNAAPSEGSLTEKCRMVSLRAATTFAACAAALTAVCTAAIMSGSSASDNGATILAAAKREWPATVLLEESEKMADSTNSLFSELSAEEVRAVVALASGTLGCQPGYKDESSVRTCFLSGSEAVTLKLPSKDAALAHLDEGAALPPRMAQVTVVRGDRPVEEGVGIYTVGPLDGKGGLARDAKVELFESHHFNRRPVDMGEATVIPAVAKAVRSMKVMLLESFGPVFPFFEPFEPDVAGRVFVEATPAVTSSLKLRISRVIFNWFKDGRVFEISWLHSLPFQFNIVHDGELEDWYAVNVSYCGQFFPTVEAILEADNNGMVSHCNGKSATVYGWDVAGPDRGTQALFEEMPKSAPVPQTWHVLGRGAVRWGDWELQATVRSATGLSLFDVRWRGHRILYELGLSDAHAHYSNFRSATQFYYSDKAFSMTQLSGSIIPGLDCPEGATLLSGNIWVFSDPVTGGFSSDTSKAASLPLACVFESDGFEGAVWRHAQESTRKVTGRPIRFLVVRGLSTVGNYDYVSEVAFKEDGAIHVRNEFAGYPEIDRAAPFHDPDADGRRMEGKTSKASDPYWGSRVRQDMVAQLHTHFCVWKVDLDVLGRKNEFHTTKSVTKHVDGGLPMKSQVTSLVETEDPDQLFIANAAAPGVWTITNPDELNEVTHKPRGYAIVMSTAPAVQTLPKDHPFSIAASFARRHLAVSVRKEEEQQATHSLDHFPVTEPLLSVDNFLSDGESLKGEDLVCWVTIGKEHITRSEDIPLVSNFGVQFALLPWGYEKQNPTMQLPMFSESHLLPDMVNGKP